MGEQEFDSWAHSFDNNQNYSRTPITAYSETKISLTPEYSLAERYNELGLWGEKNHFWIKL